MTTTTITTLTSTVRGGGVGRSAWVARITGTDPKYGLAREFVPADRSGLSRSGKSGPIRFEITEPGYYEYRHVMLSRGERAIGDGTANGFLHVAADGTVTDVTRADVLAALEG